ncbi:MAG TPA: hypothetical protein VG051_03845 [Candidatus Acidoferrum sp.]|nr:hypothetical protein [Candidatus Acidoferrum sp.]
MELLSMLNPPITDIFNDPRVTSAALLKMIDEQYATVNRQVGELMAQVKKEDVSPFDIAMFACLQHHLHVTTLNTKLAARQTDLMYVTTQLNRTLERLTTWLIGLTMMLAILALPLAIEAISKWVK